MFEFLMSRTNMLRTHAPKKYGFVSHDITREKQRHKLALALYKLMSKVDSLTEQAFDLTFDQKSDALGTFRLYTKRRLALLQLHNVLRQLKRCIGLADGVIDVTYFSYDSLTELSLMLEIKDVSAFHINSNYWYDDDAFSQSLSIIENTVTDLFHALSQLDGK